MPSPFVVPASGAENPDNYFEFQLTEGGETYRLPFLQYLPGPAADLLENPGNRGEFGFVKELIRRVDPTVAAAIVAAKAGRDRVVGIYKYQQVKDAAGEVVKDKDGNPVEERVLVRHGIHSMWAEASKVSQGESVASDDS